MSRKRPCCDAGAKAKYKGIPRILMKKGWKVTEHMERLEVGIDGWHLASAVHKQPLNSISFHNCHGGRSTLLIEEPIRRVEPRLARAPDKMRNEKYYYSDERKNACNSPNFGSQFESVEKHHHEA